MYIGSLLKSTGTLESWRCWGLLGALEVLDSAGDNGIPWEL